VSVNLRKITKDNYRECIKLSVADDQVGFVAPNVRSLGEAAYESDVYPLAIYDDDTMAGFLMYGRPPFEKGNWWIIRLMVDRNHQRKGYGKEAMRQVIELIKQEETCKFIRISYEPHNEVARKLYADLGFYETGEVIWEETVAQLDIEGR
jgi:diamine N-acetyltransferase